MIKLFVILIGLLIVGRSCADTLSEDDIKNLKKSIYVFRLKTDEAGNVKDVLVSKSLKIEEANRLAKLFKNDKIKNSSSNYHLVFYYKVKPTEGSSYLMARQFKLDSEFCIKDEKFNNVDFRTIIKK